MWKLISTAPQDGTLVDLVGSCWAFDRIHFSRFTDCYWSKSQERWSGLLPDWIAVFWMEIPKIPEVPHG